ncbi:MAG: lytic transglycosylase domain-containing protein [Proteobacteria bacterium]|nr:lytic transglycosylase domain-containing protein [Pseudomonadota bacterium]
MRIKARFFLFAIACVGLMLPLTENISWGRLKDPGLSEEAIRHAWKEFSENKDAAQVRGSYPYMACFKEAAGKHRVPLALLLAVARGESNFNPKARSNKECLGIMQIQWPGTAKDLGITERSDLFDPCININAGARYLSRLLEKFRGDPYLAVASYNYGPNAVSPEKVPEGARWYAAYIHRHLGSVLSGPFEKTGRVLIMEFTFYKMAANFVAYIEKQVEGLPLEIFKSQKYTYDVYYTYKTTKERNEYLQMLMHKTGIKPKKRGVL